MPPQLEGSSPHVASHRRTDLVPEIVVGLVLGLAVVAASHIEIAGLLVSL